MKLLGLLAMLLVASASSAATQDASPAELEAEACAQAIHVAGVVANQSLESWGDHPSAATMDNTERLFQRYEALLAKGCANRTKGPSDKCPSPWKNVGGNKATPRWNFFDKVAMPILFPDRYGQPAMVPSLSLDARLWLILQAKMESGNNPGGDWNIFNNQYDASTPLPNSKVVSRLEYVCDAPSTKTFKVPKGWSDYDAGKGKYLCPVNVRVVSAAGPVEAVNNDMAFLKAKYPGIYAALTSGNPDFDAWLGSLAGYGTLAKYRDKAALGAEARELARDLSRYLDARIKAIADADDCTGGKTVSDAEMATLKGVAAAVAKIAR